MREYQIQGNTIMKEDLEKEPYMIEKEMIRMESFIERDWFEDTVLGRDEIHREDLTEELEEENIL